MWTWPLILSKININIVSRLYFTCTCLYRSLFRLYLKQLNKKWKIKNGQRTILRFFNFIYAIRKRIVCIRLYLFYFRLYLRRYAFQILRNLHIEKLANFQDIEMRLLWSWHFIFQKMKFWSYSECTPKSSGIPAQN